VSAAKKSARTWELTGQWAGAWKIFAALGVVGLGGAAVGYTQDARRFAFSWLFAFIAVLTIALGSMFFVLVQRLTSAGWSVTVRRTAEFFMHGVLVLIPLFIPIILSMPQLFPWLHAGGGEHGAAKSEPHSQITLVAPAYAQDQPPAQPPPGGPHPPIRINPQPNVHGDRVPPGVHPGRPGLPPGAHGGAPDAVGGHPLRPGVHGGAPGMADPHEVIEEDLMKKKAAWLDKTFFLVRVGVYFLIWVILAVRLFGYSTAQDVSKDPQLTVRAQRFAPVATVLFALSLTFGAFDWIMSLEPSWFSTIFGVVIFASAVVSSYAVLILTTMALKNAGPLEGAVTIEHYHDLGKLMWGFLIFWGYVSFSQLMLIWYAALPEETTFFHNRWDYHPWRNVSVIIILGHFVVPFFWLISRNFKRQLNRLQIGALIILVMHVINIYWYVMPNFHIGKEGFHFHWMDVACLFAIGGVYGAYVFWRMTQYPLVPIGDPRLERSLHFQNA
jgi:hypothetical protein